MNKQELVDQMAEKAGISKKQAAAALDAALESITDAVAAGDKVQLIGFGSFEPKKREARTGRNPRTNEIVEIPASVVPAFKAGKAFKAQVAK